MRRLVVFPDTNVFLQCKALAELPWLDLFEADEITLLVSAPVQDEIDGLKYDGNRRRARRARSANELFTNALDSPNETRIIRESAPRVLLTFSPGLPTQRETAPTLDLKRGDDRLIEEAQHYRQKHDPQAVILTGDTGLKLRARRHGVAVTSITDAWLLAEETDDRDKEINALKAELIRLQESEPKLEISIGNAKGESLSKIVAVLPYYAPLTEDEIDDLLTQVRVCHPKADDFGATPPAWRPGEFHHALDIWEAPRQQEIDDYLAAYDDWVAHAHSRFQRINHVVNVSARLFPMQIQLQNTGMRPADEVLFELTAHDGVRFYISSDGRIPEMVRTMMMRLQPRVILDAPPTAPTGQHLSRAIGHLMRDSGLDLRVPHVAPISPHLLPSHVAALQRDRHTFHRTSEGDNPSTKCSFGRAEFRHGADAHTFLVWLIFPPDDSLKHSRVHCRVSARNLVDPVERWLPVELSYERRSALELARDWKVGRDTK